jgi:hypothetical protein
MATVKGTVEGVSTKWEKYTIQVNGTWYGTKMEWATVKPNKGDVVEFDDGGGKYTKNLKIVTVGSGGPSTGGTYVPKGTLGVELGHAANLAMQVVLAKYAQEKKPHVIGDKNFYVEFSENTRIIKAVMQGLREEYESTPNKIDDSVVVMKSSPKAAEDVF